MVDVAADRDVGAAKDRLGVGEIDLAGLSGGVPIGGRQGSFLRGGDSRAKQRRDERAACEQCRTVVYQSTHHSLEVSYRSSNAYWLPHVPRGVKCLLVRAGRFPPPGASLVPHRDGQASEAIVPREGLRAADDGEFTLDIGQ